jgi:hypothetical protein
VEPVPQRWQCGHRVPVRAVTLQGGQATRTGEVDEPVAGVDVGVQLDVDDFGVAVVGALLELRRTERHQPTLAAFSVGDVGGGLPRRERGRPEGAGVSHLDRAREFQASTRSSDDPLVGFIKAFDPRSVGASVAVVVVTLGFLVLSGLELVTPLANR